jgi:C-terminal processing protease CtpA/Prc
MMQARADQKMVSEQNVGRVEQIARTSDSILVEGATLLFQARAITRSEFERYVGPVRADSIIRSAQADTARRDIDKALAEARKSATAETVVESAFSRMPATTIGVALLCEQCGVVNRAGGHVIQFFEKSPEVREVVRGSIAERVGIQQGDTLTTVDGIPLTNVRGGARLASIEPGQTLQLGWRRRGVDHTATLTLSGKDSQLSPDVIQKVGDAHVVARGANISWSRDPRTGAVVITGDSISVTIMPGGAVRPDGGK